MATDGGIVVDLLRLRIYAQLFGLVETEQALRIAIRRAAREVGPEARLSDLQLADGAFRMPKAPDHCDGGVLSALWPTRDLQGRRGI